MTVSAPVIRDIIARVQAIPGAEHLTIARTEYEPKMFGNAIVEFSEPNYEVRFMRDKGEVFLEVANPQDRRWWSADIVCELIGCKRPGLDLLSNLQVFAELIPILEKMFGAGGYCATRERLEKLVTVRREEMLRERSES
jgi:hypothetical protein